MKKLMASILIATHVGASTPVFNPDSAAKRMLIEDGVDGKLSISTVERAYGIYTEKKDNWERAMWLALMKDPTLLELYMSEGLAREVNVVYPEGRLGTARHALYITASVAAALALALCCGWIERHRTTK